LDGNVHGFGKVLKNHIPPQGLNDAEAAALLKAEGPNELPQPDRRTMSRIFLEVMREPMLALLFASGVVYLLLGELQDALILVAFAMLSILITVVQDARTEHVLEALRDLTSPGAMVIRAGVRKRIPGRDVVRGDLVLLAEGDRVPADAMVVEGHDLQTDESLLTGESVPVRKLAAKAGQEVEIGRPGGDDLPFVFSGTLVVKSARLAIRSAGLKLNPRGYRPRPVGWSSCLLRLAAQ
jgi:Ca2+-transporting ATPase